MKIFRICLFLYANFVTTNVAYYRKCYNYFSLCLTTNTDEQPSYRESKFKLTHSSADTWCKEQSSSLAIITNQTVQSAIEAFINDSSAKLDSDVITNGNRYRENTWQWINGLQSAIQLNDSYDAFRYAYLLVSPDRNFSLLDSFATSKINFICSYYLNRNSKCSDGYQQQGSRCYKIHYKQVTWFDANNLCLQENRSELAIFEHGISSLTTEWLRHGEYWIGLTKEIWTWRNGQNVKYSNWENGRPGAIGGDCLCLNATTGKWTDCNCLQEYRHICIQDYYTSGSPSTATTKKKKITKVMTKITTTMTEMTTTTTRRITFSSTLTTTQSTLAANPSVGDSTSQFYSTYTQILDDNFGGKTSQRPSDMKYPGNSGMLLGLGVGSALLLILIIVIAVVAFIKNQRSRSGNVGPRNGNSPPPTMHKDDAPNTVYAVVMPNANEPVRSPSEKTSNQTVYAELDLEPKRKITQRVSESVQGPSEKASNQAVYAEVGLAPKGNTGPTHERAAPESEYANSSLVDSVYANSAQTKV